MSKTPVPPRFASPALIDDLLAPWQQALGGALPAYRNHVHRLFHLTRAFYHHSTAESDRLLAVAAVFHDLGIWSHGTIDYLEPSALLASACLRELGLAAHIPLVSAMILDHHRLRATPVPLAEAFRRADWADVSLGELRFGLPEACYSALRAQFPWHGFHGLLLQLTARQLRQHPLRPLPMVRW